VAGGNGKCRGLGCGTSGACTSNLHSWVEAEGEVSCGVRRGLAVCTVRRKGSALDRSAAMIRDEQAEGITMRDLYSHLKGSETSR